MKDSYICGCIPRCCMILRETEGVILTTWDDKKLIYGPNLCLVQPCWYEWERIEKVELFVNEFILIENSQDPSKNRFVNFIFLSLRVVTSFFYVVFDQAFITEAI